MKISTLGILTANHARLLRRSWLFRFFLGLIFVAIIYVQVMNQSSLAGYTSGVQLMASFLPYMNAYFFVLLAVFPILFLAGVFLKKEQKLDSLETVFSRPESNAEYIWGMACGFIRVFLGMGLLSLGGALAINLFATKAPLDIWSYLFYFFTMIVPTVVFMVGFSFAVFTWVRHQALSIIILLGYLALTIFYLGDGFYGLFDSLGIYWTNVFSGITGRPDMMPYLLQRGMWLFLGLGFTGLTVLGFSRLPNRPHVRKIQMGVTVVLLACGVLSGISSWGISRQTVTGRGDYAEIYKKYAAFPRLSITDQVIRYDQQGASIQAVSQLTLSNDHLRTIDDWVLYLNPALAVSGVTAEGKPLSYEREGQVLRFREPFSPGETRTVEIAYAGGIDNRVCYLDVPDVELNEYLQGEFYMTCRFGKAYTYLSSDYTLLIPECLWYPVAYPPVNPVNSYAVPKDFTRYTLEVTQPAGKQVISQGRRSMAGDRVVFSPTASLPGVTLCIGEYEVRSLEVDSVFWQLYLFAGHDFLLDNLQVLKDTVPDLIREMKTNLERAMDRNYPYSEFVLAESPITFASYFRNERGGSEFVQPGMVFFPERSYQFASSFNMQNIRGFGMNMRGEREMTETQQAFILATGMLPRELASEFSQGQSEFSLLQLFNPTPRAPMTGNRQLSRNLRDVAPLFYNQTLSIVSEAFPVLDASLTLLLRNRRTLQQGGNPFGMGGNISDSYQNQALDYLSACSMQEAVEHPSLPPAVLRELISLKATELGRYFEVYGTSMSDFLKYLDKYSHTRGFSRIRFDDFNSDFREAFGLDWNDYLSDWYRQNRLPVFRISGFTLHKITDNPEEEAPANPVFSFSGGPGGGRMGAMSMMMSRFSVNNEPSQVEFSICNDSEVDGIVSLSWQVMESGSSGGGMWGGFGGVIRFNAGGGGGGGGMAAFGGLSSGTQESVSYLLKAGEAIRVSHVLPEQSMSPTLSFNISRNLPRSLQPDNGPSLRDSLTRVTPIGKAVFDPDPQEIVVDNTDKGFRIHQPRGRTNLAQWFNREAPKTYRYPNAQSLMMADKKWGVFVDGKNYGDTLRTAYYRAAGKGTSYLEWSCRIEQAGEYEISVYLPLSPIPTRFDRNAWRVREVALEAGQGGRRRGEPAQGGRQEVAEQLQYYTLKTADGEEEIPLNMSGPSGWISLGRFRLVPGEYYVRLDDRGDERQVIVGDAVKWERIGE